MRLQRQIDRLLAERASEWHEILAHANESQRAEFVAWLKQSPVHVAEYLEIAYADRVLRHLDPEREEDIDALLAQAVPATVPLPVRGRIRGALHADPTRRPGRRRWLVASAAAVATCVLTALLVYQPWQNKWFSTPIGEQRTIQLADASLVTLNADSRIQVRLSEQARNIELQRGEAVFNVARDPVRPFRVRTRTALIEAVGTQFDVNELQDGARVSVLEGRVNVLTPQTSQSLRAGEEAWVRLDGSIEHRPHTDTRHALSWREGRLAFADTPLEEVVEEFNRYNRNMRLRLEAVPRGTYHYNGLFNVSDPESLAELLAREPDLIVERRGREIVIRKR
jgi:transmembrane sensor